MLENDNFTELRQQMVEKQLIPRGITDEKTLYAMRTVPRHNFLPKNLQKSAYADSPLPLGEGQTISQPYIVALMTQTARVERNSKVLDIGTGSGYAAAIFALITQKVYSIERIPALAERAEENLKKSGIENVEIIRGDGTLGWKKEAPYDVIAVTAGAPNIPEELCKQLAEKGRLIIPVGDSQSQKLLLIKRNSDHFTKQTVEYVRFVPLIGEGGW